MAHIWRYGDMVRRITRLKRFKKLAPVVVYQEPCCPVGFREGKIDRFVPSNLGWVLGRSKA